MPIDVTKEVPALRGEITREYFEESGAQSPTSPIDGYQYSSEEMIVTKESKVCYLGEYCRVIAIRKK